jgi:NADH dehydrogenase FAD-containing subunit
MVARDGKNVTLVTPRLFAGFDLPPTAVPLYYERMAEYGATIITHSVVTRVQADGVVVLDVFAHKEQLLTGVDTLVWAGDNRAAGELFQALRGVVGEIYPVGDCVAPRKIDAAIREGFLAGLKI